MKRAFLMAVLAAVCGAACAEEDTNLYYKVYFLPKYEGCGCPWHKSKWSADDARSFCTRNASVQWPAGSQIIQPTMQDEHLIVCNTRTNLLKLDDFFIGQGGSPRVDIEYFVLAFRRRDIEDLLGKQGISCDSLLGLRARNRHKVIASANAVTKSGNEACPKEVQEVNYPTVLQYVVVTNQTSVSWALVPSDFEMTEVGVIPQVVPQVRPNGKTIDMMADCKRVTLVRWESFDSVAGAGRDNKKVIFKRPVFGVSEVNTCVEMTSGETVLLGGGCSVDRDWSEYHFLKATVVWPKLPK